MFAQLDFNLAQVTQQIGLMNAYELLENWGKSAVCCADGVDQSTKARTGGSHQGGSEVLGGSYNLIYKYNPMNTTVVYMAKKKQGLALFTNFALVNEGPHLVGKIPNISSRWV